MARYEMAIAEAPVDGSSADTFFCLGLMYCIGREVKQDYIAAHKWFNLAALKGSLEAKKYRCGLWYFESAPIRVARARQRRRWG